MRNVRGGQSGCPGGLVEGRLRDAATCGGRLNWFHVHSLGLASQASGGGTAISMLQRRNIKENTSALQASGGGTAIRRLRRPSRPPISPASCGRAGGLIAAPCTPG